MVEAVARAYDADAPHYDQDYSRLRDRVEDAMTAFLLRRAWRASTPLGGTLLDVGCGTGLAIRLTGIRPELYVGIDPSPGMLAVARSRYPRHLFLEGAADDPPPGQFALALVGFGVLNYVPSLAEALDGIARHLARGASLVGHVFHPRRLSRPRQVIASDYARIILPWELESQMLDAGLTLRRHRLLLPGSDHVWIEARRG